MKKINLSTLEEIEITLDGNERKGTFIVTGINQSGDQIGIRLESLAAFQERNSMMGW